MATICITKKKELVIITVQGTLTGSTMKLIDKYVTKNQLSNVMISQKQKTPTFPTAWQQLVTDYYKSKPKRYRVRMF